MNDVVDAGQQEWAALRVDALRGALQEAERVESKLSRAFRVLDRALVASRSATAPGHAPRVAQLLSEVEELTAQMRTMRRWSLEMAHFLEHWHPVGPAFSSAGPAQEGGRSVGTP